MTSSDPWNVPLGIEDKSGTDGVVAGRAAAGGGAGVRAGGVAAGVRAGGVAAGVRAGGVAAGLAPGVELGRCTAGVAGTRFPPVVTGNTGGVLAHAPSGPAVIAVA
jgi:hypothetical protein